MAITSSTVEDSYCAEEGKGTGKISIELEGQEGDISVSWSNGETTLNIENVTSGTHTITITDSQGQIVSKLLKGEIPIYNEAQICFITADLLDYTRNKIYIKTLSSPYNIDKYLIYRESFIANQYDLIGQIDYVEGRVAAFVDEDADNRSKSFRYRVAILDNCGNVSEMSDIHETSHLSANQGVAGEVNLQWTGYKGLEFSTYEIYKSINYNTFRLTQVSANDLAFSDFDVIEDNSYRYFVSPVVEVECIPQGIIEGEA